MSEIIVQGHEKSKKHFLDINVLICDLIGLVDCNPQSLTEIAQRNLSKQVQF